MRPIPVLLTLFQKKEKEKFGQFKNYLYLCTRKTKSDAPVAQLVEHLTLNQGVQGSSPCGFEPLRVYKKQERVSAKRCTRSSVGRAPDS